jgi:GNAT superfamily N-acetyltransferase
MASDLLPFPAPGTDVLVLRDGRRVSLHAITPAARGVIADAVARMSPETSRRRFFTVRRQLSAPELDVLTEMDGVDRYAIGASATRPDGGPEGVASVRYVRVRGTPDAAEIALVVMDNWQSRGLGAALLARLARYAVRQGIVRFIGHVLPESGPMIRLLLRFGAHIGRVGDHLEFDLPLASALARAA